MRSPVHNASFWVARRAALAGDQLAVEDDHRALDYAALEDRTARLAGWLAARGVGPGERVAILLGNRSAYLEAVFATARLGAIAVPLNARLAPPEIRELLDDCTPRVLLHEASLEALVERAVATAVQTPALRLRVGADPDAYEAALSVSAPVSEVRPASPEDPMLLLYTSGTTGVPKGALLPQRKTLFNTLNAQIFFDLTRNDRVLVVVPLFHSFGLLILAMPTLYAGGSVLLQARFDPEAVWVAAERRRITFFGGVPSMFRALLEALEADPARDLGSLRFLFTAGAAIPVELIRAFERRGLLLKQGYGQTETSILCCLDGRDALRKAGSVGRPVFHAELRVVDPSTFDRTPEAWRPVAPGETGEIVVRGPTTMLGYWNRPEASAETLREGWLRTGDLATLDTEGFVTLVGRARELYISGGENVYPAQVEAVFEQHPGIREIAVIGVPDDRWGEVGEAYVVPEEGAILDPDELLAFGRERLAVFKVPHRFVVVPRLPRTETGKVQKQRLGQPAPSDA